MVFSRVGPNQSIEWGQIRVSKSKGLSSPTVNVFWGSLNLVIGYLLVFRVGTFDFRRIQDVLIAGVGGLLMAVMLSRAFTGRESGK